MIATEFLEAASPLLGKVGWPEWLELDNHYRMVDPKGKGYVVEWESPSAWIEESCITDHEAACIVRCWLTDKLAKKNGVAAPFAWLLMAAEKMVEDSQ